MRPSDSNPRSVGATEELCILQLGDNTSDLHAIAKQGETTWDLHSLASLKSKK